MKIHQTLHKVTDDLSHRYQFNTLVSSLMELANALADLPREAPHRDAILQRALEILTLMLSPAAPHLAEQLWTRLGGQGLCMHAAWPEADPAWLTADQVTVVVQVNGKVRGRVTVPGHAGEDERSAPPWPAPRPGSTWTARKIVKVVVPAGGKLVSIVVR